MHITEIQPLDPGKVLDHLDLAGKKTESSKPSGCGIASIYKDTPTSLQLKPFCAA